jgi:hypothetical protein
LDQPDPLPAVATAADAIADPAALPAASIS